MACVRLTKLSDSELLAYLAGDADAAIGAHLALCHECQQRAAALAAQERRLTVSLYRRACPPSLTLGEYQLGLLPATERRTIARHLRQCPHCTNEVQMLTTYLDDVAPTLEVAPTLGLQKRVRILVARLVENLPSVDPAGGLFTGTPPALAGVRGDAGAHLVYAVEEVQVIIDVQTDAQQPAYRVLLGLLLGLADPQQITAQLWPAEAPVADRQVTTAQETSQRSAPPARISASPAKPVAATTVDELGNFVLSALTPGIYDLVLSSDKAEVHIQTLLIV
ncbi:MAG: zf-HC2 domain-containing protein [Caldilinea sp. CFX5]|nr:zf-HC2 domain-containing protein [Caldilinea sp. CFX5]